jgi:predicted nucleic acid-binding protein
LILADTSVWVDHLRKGDPALVALLESGQILMHPYVVGELALAQLHQRDAIVSALQNLPHATVARDDEVLMAINQWALAGLGIDYIDVHLLAAIPLSPGTLLWTRDKRLRAVAASIGLHANLK